MAGIRARQVVTAGERLTGSKLPAGLRNAWPECVAAWKHESGAYLTLHVLGGTACLAWRARGHWAAWPFDVVTFDDSRDAAANLSDAVAQAEGLFLLGPSEEVTAAQISMRDKARVRARDAYRKKKEIRGPSQQDMTRMARDAMAGVLAKAGLEVRTIGRGEKSGETKAATSSGLQAVEQVPKIGRPRLPTMDEETARREKTRKTREAMRGALERAEFNGADIDSFCTTLGATPAIAKWLISADGKTAMRDAIALTAAESIEGENVETVTQS